MENLSLLHQQDMAMALRDFFAARNANEMRQAFLALNINDAQGIRLDYADEVWTQVEYAFNKLFVGPGEVIAPLFASVYLESDGVLMGQVTVSLRHLMEELHICVPIEGSIPEDFLPYEIDILLYIDGLIQKNIDNNDLVLGLNEARTWLIEHMQSWLMLFIQRVEVSCNVPTPLLQVIEQLKQWVSCLSK